MNPANSEIPDVEPTTDRFPDDLVLIIGAGHFGKRAACILRDKSDSPILIIDKEKKSLEKIETLPTEKVVSDGVRFLAKNIDKLNPSSFIIPAIPLHLAAEWLKAYLEARGWKITLNEPPEEILSHLPHVWEGIGGTLLISYADFLCPDDCPEPLDHCPTTGETRPEPLHDLLSHLDVPKHQIYIVRSRQLAPGLGGYRAEDLRDLLKKVKQKEGKWLVGTACKCHGALTALEAHSAKGGAHSV